TKFFVSTGTDPINPTEIERKLPEYIKDEPLSIHEILNKMRRFPSPAALDALIQQRAIQAIGFTPTDALHVLGEYTESDVEAAQIGASMLGRLLKQSPEAFSTETKRRVARNIAEDLIAYLIEGMPRSEIDRGLMGRNYT